MVSTVVIAAVAIVIVLGLAVLAVVLALGARETRKAQRFIACRRRIHGLADLGVAPQCIGFPEWPEVPE